MPVQTPLQLGLECLKAQKLDKAIEYLEQATARFHEDYQGFNYLGIAYARKELFDRAIGAFQAAVRLRPRMPGIRYNLGLAYQADGFPDKAKDEFQEALRLDPAYQKAKEALKVLDSSEDSLSGRACARHTDEPAIAICSYCRLPVCQRCKAVVRGAIYCTTCAEKQK